MLVSYDEAAGELLLADPLPGKYGRFWAAKASRMFIGLLNPDGGGQLHGMLRIAPGAGTDSPRPTTPGGSTVA